jgi:hypothetical protein
MDLQLWPVEAIENILWAIQTGNRACLPEKETSEAYRHGFSHGFETAIQHLIPAFQAEAGALEIWMQDQVENILRVAQTVLQLDAASGGLDQAVVYDQGFQCGLETGLNCVALSFGAGPGSPVDDAAAAAPITQAHDIFWFRGDVDNILATFLTIIAATPLETARSLDYNQGFDDALQCVASSLGVSLMAPQNRPAPIKLIFWRRQDIAHKLQTVHRTQTALQNGQRPADYDQGFETALRCLALAWGISTFPLEYTGH